MLPPPQLFFTPLWDCARNCCLKQFASQAPALIRRTVAIRAADCTQLKMLFHSSAGMRRKTCADVSNASRHQFPDIRKNQPTRVAERPGVGEEGGSLDLGSACCQDFVPPGNQSFMNRGTGRCDGKRYWRRQFAGEGAVAGERGPCLIMSER